MAEINTVIAEASQDLQTIEDFVNLPADSEVYPRLLPSVNVGTLSGARQAIFEAGGLPATPFATKALMEASALVDGDYAMVTDDTVNNNGLYVKTSGNWLLSKYDINQKAFIHRGAVATGTALISYTTAGTYSVPAGITITDAPEGILSNRNYMLVNVHAWDNGSIIVQTLEGASNVKEKWGRVIRKDGTIFYDWKSFKVEVSDLVGNYSYRGTLTADSNLDDALESGLYLVTGAATNLPNDATGGAYKLDVDIYGTFVKQTLYDNNYVDKVWVRSFRTTGSSNVTWVYSGKSIATNSNLGGVIAGKGLEVSATGILKTVFSGTDGLIGSSDLAAKYNYRKSLTKATDDLNELYASGNYVVIGDLVPNRPADVTNVGFLNVEATGTSSIQTWVNDGSKSTMYVRRIQSVVGGETYTTPWYCLNSEHISNAASAAKLGTIKVGANLSIAADGTLSASGSGSAAFQGKKLLCFGDSITEFKNYPELVGAKLGANALNIGFGGCRMAKHNLVDYNEMSMYRVADNIGLNDYTELLAGAQAVYTRTGDDNRPQANLLANADFSTVDYITILYGTNDFNESVPIGTNTDVTADGSTFKGSLNYSIKRILETYPHVKILLITPPYRFRQGTSGTGADSDDSPNASGEFAIDYVDAIVELGALNKVPVLDLYRESGINKYTAPLYLNPPPDGVHLTQTGAELLAAKIASKLIATY